MSNASRCPKPLHARRGVREKKQRIASPGGAAAKSVRSRWKRCCANIPAR